MVICGRLILCRASERSEGSGAGEVAVYLQVWASAPARENARFAAQNSLHYVS
jgi:hypothetical protein